MCFKGMKIITKKRLSLAGIFAFVIILCSACSPALSIQANGTDGASISFKTGSSPVLEKTFKSMMQSVSGTETDSGASIFNKETITTMMETAGLLNVITTAPDTGSILTKGNAAAISQGSLAKAGILTRTANSLSLALGPKQFQALYAMLDEESQAYFDLMMIPSLNEDTMTIPQYNDLLSSVYGQKFADEITTGTLSVQLSSPDGKKKAEFVTTLGEILTLSEEKNWTVRW